MIVEGQVHGGITQGIGQALTEGVVYDEHGQLITGSYMDYTMPRADDVPSYKVEHASTPSPTNPLGIKGCGRSRRHRSTPGRDQRDHGCHRKRRHRDAGDVVQGLGRDSAGQDIDGGGIREEAMYPTKYHKATSVDAAAAALSGAEDGAILAGGQTLLPTMKQHLASPSDLVDIRGAGLSGITVSGGSVSIGATTTHAEVAGSAEIPVRLRGAVLSRGRDRGPRRAAHGDHRRLRRQQRPGGGLSLCGAGTRRDGGDECP